MTLDPAEFIRRFLMHVLPSGFHRIRHSGLFASAVRARNIERVRALLAVARPSRGNSPSRMAAPTSLTKRMNIIETFDGVRPARSGFTPSDQDRHVMSIGTQLPDLQIQASSPPIPFWRCDAARETPARTCSGHTTFAKSQTQITQQNASPSTEPSNDDARHRNTDRRALTPPFKSP